MAGDAQPLAGKDAADNDAYQAAAQLAAKLACDGKLEESVQLLESKLKEKPNEPTMLHNLGVVLMDLGRFADAENRFWTAYESQKESGRVQDDTVYGLAQAMTQQGETPKLLQAEAIFRDMLEHTVKQERGNPRDMYRAYASLANNLEQQKRWAEAAEAWRVAVDLATHMFGKADEATLMLARAERLSRWQKYFRYMKWSVTIAITTGTASGPLMLDFASRLGSGPVAVVRCVHSEQLLLGQPQD